MGKEIVDFLEKLEKKAERYAEFQPFDRSFALKVVREISHYDSFSIVVTQLNRSSSMYNLYFLASLPELWIGFGYCKWQSVLRSLSSMEAIESLIRFFHKVIQIDGVKLLKDSDLPVEDKKAILKRMRQIAGFLPPNSEDLEEQEDGTLLPPNVYLKVRSKLLMEGAEPAVGDIDGIIHSIDLYTRALSDT
jgi:hypothetical protein